MTNIYSGNIFGNFCFNNAGSGIFSDSAFSGQPVIISNNSCIGNGLRGIHLRVAKYHVVSQNNVTSNSGHGIFLEGAQFNVVSNNLVRSNGDEGIRLDNRISVNADDNSISGNVVDSNTGNEIELSVGADNNVVDSNIGAVVNNGTGNTIGDNS